VVAIVVDGRSVETLTTGQQGVIILDRTPFYAESGGQMGDTGHLTASGVDFQVSDTRKLAGVFHGHEGRLTEGEIARGDQLAARIDDARRADIVRHHSATHLLHAALRQVLGEHVQQKGSLVAPDRLRFDFSHHEPVSEAELATIERIVNEQIQANAAAEAREMSFDAAMEAGALAFFGDKYGDEVRVLNFGDFSIELCGGTHVQRMGDIGAFKIISETGISSGVRRIEAVAGQVAMDWFQRQDRTLRKLSGQLKTAPEQLEERVEQLLNRSRELEKELERLKSKLASAAGSDLATSATDLGDFKLIAGELEGVDPNGLRDTVDQLKNKLGSGVVVLGTRVGTGVRLVAGVTQDLTSRFKAGEVVNHVAAQVGGKGGGRPDFAQAGGTEPEGLKPALASVEAWLTSKL
jgi:alanyl-tRNA synthetase